MEKTQQGQSLWRNRDYLLLYSGQLISNTGSGLTQITFPLLVLALTDSPLQAGLVSALNALLYMVLTLPAGALLDRWNRKQAMIICDIGRALTLASIVGALVMDHLTLLHLYLATLIAGTLEIFFDLAELACLPQVVANEQLPEALGQNQAALGIVTFTSPSLGAALYGVRHFWPFLVDALSYGISAASLFLIQTPFQQERQKIRNGLLGQIVEGWRWLWQQPLLRTMAILTSVNVFCGAGQLLVIIVIAQSMRASNLTIGLIFSLGGLGSIVGALLSGRARQHFSFAQIIISVLWLYALLWFGLGLAPTPFWLGLITTLLFFISPFYNAVSIGQRLAMTPDELQSRVNSVARLIARGLAPLSLVLTGWLLQTHGPLTTVVLAGGGQLSLALVATRLPQLRQVKSLSSPGSE